jgi:hypothetical protein
MGLHCWSKHLFEKLGWMTLAHQDCQLTQLKCYVENIHNLIQHIELKLDYLHDLHKKSEHSIGLEERIYDMKILHDNMKVLKKHAEHLVKTCKSKKTSMKVNKKKMMKGGKLYCDDCPECTSDDTYELSGNPPMCRCKSCQHEWIR